MTRQAYYQANKDRIKAKSRERYWGNRETILERERRKRLADPDAHKERLKLDYEKYGERRRESARKYARENPGRRYGLTTDQFREIESVQAGLCMICRRPQRLSVDHDHCSGKVRGLLCQPCNLGIGTFGDDPKLLRAAAEYLEKHGS